MAGTHDPPPDDPDRLAEREAMVAAQIALRGISSASVLRAMTIVPRHAFVPDDLRTEAYEDGPLLIGSGQTISQPYIVALMTELLALGPDERVLEVGTGSGYQTAVLAELTPHVFSVEIVAALAGNARAALDALGYGSVVSRAGDGYGGWPEQAPFDAILVTAAPDHLPPALVAQLGDGGRLVIPVGKADAIQQLLLVTRQDDGTLSRREIAPVRFVPLTNERDDGA